jgi:microcin C transport system substrate-binding protein
MAQLSHRIEEIIHREALFVPGAMQDYYRIGHWRWLRFPEGTFNVKVSYDPIESYVWWIDEDMKAETLAARRSGETFPEVDAVYDQHRQKQ